MIENVLTYIFTRIFFFFVQGTSSNLDQYKLSKTELERRKNLYKSKNADTARGELHERDHTRPPSQAEIETELKRLQVYYFQHINDII